MSVTRRQFLGSSAAAVIAAGTMAQGKVFGANDRIRVAVVGINGRGGSHIGSFTDLKGSEVVALCDVDKNVLAGRAKLLQVKTGNKPKTYVDMRDLMADDDVDAVSFATPNHWHTLGSIWACQAGKDVYVEKPLSHNVWEGCQLVAAATKYDRIVLHGTQRRSEPRWVRAIQRLQAGEIGEVYMARALCYKRRNSIGLREPEDPPAHLDWNLWQGPAQERPYCANYVHYNWHWFWDYGSGDLGNQGVHQMDIAVWGLAKGFPTRVTSMGGRYGYEDQGETANTQVCNYMYDDGKMLVFEVRGRYTNSEGGVMIGNLFYGSEGYMVDTKLYDTDGKEIPDSDKPNMMELGVSGNHFYTFLQAVRDRKLDDGRGTALDGHLASGHCHLGNVAYRLGRGLTFDPAAEKFVGEGADRGNPMLTRDYREPCVVPQVA